MKIRDIDIGDLYIGIKMIACNNSKNIGTIVNLGKDGGLTIKWKLGGMTHIVYKNCDCECLDNPYFVIVDKRVK